MVLFESVGNVFSVVLAGLKGSCWCHTLAVLARSWASLHLRGACREAATWRSGLVSRSLHHCLSFRNLVESLLCLQLSRKYGGLLICTRIGGGVESRYLCPR